MKLSKMAKLRILRVSLVAIGTGLASAGGLLVAGASTAAVLVSALGAAITAAGTGIALGEFNGAEAAGSSAAARARSAAPPVTGEPMGFARLPLLLALVAAAALAISCGPAAAPAGGEVAVLFCCGVFTGAGLVLAVRYRREIRWGVLLAWDVIRSLVTRA